MNISPRVQKTARNLLLTTGIITGASLAMAAPALADCTATVCTASGKTLDGKNQCVKSVKKITSSMASGPKDAWLRVCSAHAEKLFSAAKPLGAIAMRQEMECSGSWRGKWCKDVAKGGGMRVTDALTRAAKKISGFGDGIAKWARQARSAFNASSGVKSQARQRVVRQQRTKRADGFSEYRCNC